MSAISALFAQSVSERSLCDGYRALERLGAWWITADALKIVGVDVCAVADVRAGEFVVLLARDGHSTVIHAGLALPLRWTQMKKADPRLPPALAKLAMQIREENASADALKWQLFLGDECPDLSDCTFFFESASAMLAATLQVALISAELDATVTASAVFGQGADLQPVDGLEAKLAAARRLGLKCVCISRVQPEFESVEGLNVVRLEGRTAKEQLGRLLLELDAPPTSASFDTRCEWYERHTREDATRAQDFYSASLARDLANHAASVALFPIAQGGQLALITTGRSEVAAFSACYYSPHRIIVFSQDDAKSRRLAENTRDAIGIANNAVEVVLRYWNSSLDDEVERMSSDAAVLLAPFIAENATNQAPFSIDLTGGKTSMKFALFHAATSLSLDCFITDSRDHANGGTDVRTTRVIKLPHGASPGLGI